jgi:antitoxin CcdA
MQAALLSAPNPGRKRPVNLSLDSDLLRQGKELGINLSSIAEAALANAVREAMARRWLEENGEAIRGFNLRVGEQGVFSDGLRSF